MGLIAKTVVTNDVPLGPPSKKILKAMNVYREYHIASRKLRNHNVIANSPLPKHKEKKFDDLVTQCLVEQRNARSRWESMQRKLNLEEQVEIIERLKLL